MAKPAAALSNCLIILTAIFLCHLFAAMRRVPEAITIHGFTMGTTYQVTYFDSLQRNFKPQIDSLLEVINKAISVYDSTSEVSIFNQGNTRPLKVSVHLSNPLIVALEVAEASGGTFDPTVMPLVNAWGFGPDEGQIPDRQKIDAIRLCVGYEKIILSNNTLSKTDTCVQLDFGGIGQGYAADVISGFLKTKKISNFLVEIGGEGIASGENLTKGRAWTIGILDPHSTRENQFFKAYVSLSDKAFTTSGNYFNYREHEGRRYGHAINPKTGFPVEHNLLSASVFADDCTHADAWATAFMAMGYEESVSVLKDHPELEAFLIYSLADGSQGTFITPSLDNLISVEP